MVRLVLAPLPLLLPLLLLQLSHALRRVSDQFPSYLGAELDSNVVGAAQARILTEEEHLERSRNPGLSPAAAERVFNGKLMRAASLAQARAKAGASQNQSGLDVDRDEEYEFWAGQREDLAAALSGADGEFHKEQFKNLLAGMQPSVHMYFCMQLDVDLSEHAPGLRMRLALFGGLFVDPATGCWGGDFEAALTFDWGVKILGHTIGVGVTAAGSVNFAEVSPSRALQGGEAGLRIYAPADADLTKCHAKSPWPVLQTFWEAQVKKVFSTETVEKQVQAGLEERVAELAEFRRVYADLLDGPLEKVPAPVGHAVWAPKLVAPAEAMAAAAQRFVGLVPSYATQVMDRLNDNKKYWRGGDNERKVGFPVRYESEVLHRFRNNKGRFLARWPSSGMLGALEEQTSDSIELEGVTRKGKDADMRVINFAKVMRLSKHSGDPSFWKELSMSASNLMVRVVSDLKALFATFLAGDPNWDGSCEALPISFESTDIDGSTLENMQAYPWASKSSCAHKRINFARRSGDMGLPASQEVFPHLWCSLAEQASEGPDGAVIENLFNGEDIVELSVAQTCETVVHELRDIEPEEEISFDRDIGRFVVRRGGEESGILYQESGGMPVEGSEKLLVQLSKDSGRKGLKYKVATKVVESRPECERAQIPRSFARLFPQLVLAAVESVAQLEALLLEINACMDEVLNYGGVADSITRTMQQRQNVFDSPQSCAGLSKSDKVAFVRERAISAVRILRYALLQLGAEDPRKAEIYKSHELLYVDEDEAELLRSIAEVGSALLADALAPGFTEALGLQVAPEGQDGGREKTKADAASRRTSRAAARAARDEQLLSGFLWLGVSGVRERLLQNPDPLRRVKRGSKHLHPAVEFTNALSVRNYAAQSGLCRAGTGGLEVAHVKRTSWQTWSSKVSEESCWIGHVRPGNVFVQVMRCAGESKGEDGDFGKYVDWRVRYQATLLQGDAAGVRGLLGELLSGRAESLEAALVEAGALLGGAGSGAVVERLYPHVANSNALTGLLMAGAATTPLLGAVGAGSALAAGSSFHDVFLRFLNALAQKGMVSKAENTAVQGAAKEGAAAEEPTSAGDVDAMLAIWGAVVHRQRSVRLTAGPAALGAPTPDSPKSLTNFQRFISVHVANWNRIGLPQFSKDVPGVLSAEIHPKLELDWDVTPWVERKMNAELFLQNRQRVADCVACLEKRQAFCDWRPPLGSLWEPASVHPE